MTKNRFFIVLVGLVVCAVLYDFFHRIMNIDDTKNRINDDLPQLKSADSISSAPDYKALLNSYMPYDVVWQREAEEAVDDEKSSEEVEISRVAIISAIFLEERPFLLLKELDKDGATDRIVKLGLSDTWKGYELVRIESDTAFFKKNNTEIALMLFSTNDKNQLNENSI